jgi:autotransporter-associated beta strand protein
MRPRTGAAAAAAAVGAVFVLAFASPLHAQVYWDVNDVNPGATDTDSASGTWNASNAFWTADSTGAGGHAVFVSGSAVVFSAGNNATGSSTITISSTQTTGGFTVQEGTVIIAAAPGIVSNGVNPVHVGPGAVLSIAQAPNFATTAGSVVTLDGGTLRNTINGASNPFWDADSTWELTSNGATVDVASVGNTRFQNSINLQAGVTSAALTKIGVGEFRARTGGFTTLNVNQGLYRIEGTGALETGFGDVNGTVNVASGAAVGTSVAIASPSTRTFSLGAGAAGATFVTNAAWTIDGSIGGAGGFVLNGNGFPSLGGTNSNTLTLAGTNSYAGDTKINIATLAVAGGHAIPDASAVVIEPTAVGTTGLLVSESETIGSLAGGNSSFGGVNLALGSTLTTGGDGTSTTLAGALTGEGNLVKTGGGTMTLANANTLVGTTTVNAGTLCAAATGGLAGFDTAGRVFANTGGTLAVRAGGIGEWTAGDIDTLRASATFAAGSRLGIDTSSGSFAYGSSISGALGVTKIGGNTLTLSAANAYAGGTAVQAGTLVAAGADALAGGAVDVFDGATVQLQASLTHAVTISTVSANASGKLDITDNSVVIRDMSVAAVGLLIKSGFATGAWTGDGITSSTAAGTTLNAIGFASNGVLSKTSFKGVSPLTASDVLMKYTYYGDADLSGVVTLDDFTLFLNGYQTQGTTWVQGDFDYSGLVTLDDFTLFLAGYQQQGAPLGAVQALIYGVPQSSSERAKMLAIIQAVPEPSSMSLLMMPATALLARRRRSHP